MLYCLSGVLFCLEKKKRCEHQTNEENKQKKSQGDKLQNLTAPFGRLQDSKHDCHWKTAFLFICGSLASPEMYKQLEAINECG